MFILLLVLAGGAIWLLGVALVIGIALLIFLCRLVITLFDVGSDISMDRREQITRRNLQGPKPYSKPVGVSRKVKKQRAVPANVRYRMW